MLRVGQLEARVAALNESDGSTQADNGQSRDLIELTERVDAIHGLITAMSQDATNSAGLGPADGQADELAQMRVQMTSLANQLDVARNELKDYRARRRRRRAGPGTIRPSARQEQESPPPWARPPWSRSVRSPAGH